MHNVRPYTRSGDEGSKSLIKFEVPAPMKGNPDMGEGEGSSCNLRKDIPPELGPGSLIDYAKV